MQRSCTMGHQIWAVPPCRTSLSRRVISVDDLCRGPVWGPSALEDEGGVEISHNLFGHQWP